MPFDQMLSPQMGHGWTQMKNADLQSEISDPASFFLSVFIRASSVAKISQ
jgi:hypothetical protein